MTGRAENSVRVSGSEQSPCIDVPSTASPSPSPHHQIPRRVFDNRPISRPTASSRHNTPGYSIEHADDRNPRNCSVVWGANPPDAFSYAVEAIDATGLKIEGLKGEAAHPSLGKAVSIS